MIKYLHFASDNLFLANGYHEAHTDNGIEREYEREVELEQCIRLLVLRKPEPLRGWDLRFLRRGLELSQADFGGMVDRDAQTVARWEKSSEHVPKFVDLMIRARFAERFEPQIKLSELLSFTDGTAPALPTFIQLKLTPNGWTFDFGARTALPPIIGMSKSFAALPIGLGPVQMVSNPMFYYVSDQYMPIENSDHNTDFQLYPNLAMRSSASGKVPALLPKQINQGFHHEQKQHKTH
jgi:DNA-binding transcriptional regulator YiaG